jgi:hypothetical protein
MSTKKAVFLKGQEDYIYDEKYADAAGIQPGDLLRVRADDKVEVHGTAGGQCEVIFALQDRKLDGMTFDATYADDALIPFGRAKIGAKINGWCAAGAAAISKEDWLEPDGAGGLRKAAGLTDNSGGTANTTIEDISASPTEAQIANNFADLTAQLNALKPGARFKAAEAVDNSGGGTRARIAFYVVK